MTDSGRAALGVTVRTVLGGDGGTEPAGAGIVALEEDGAAADAGMRAYDAIAGLGGARITTALSLSEAPASAEPGEELQAGHVRGQRRVNTEVPLGTLTSP